MSFPILVNQVQISAGRLDTLTDGTLDQCIELSITPLAWGPVNAGWLSKDVHTLDPNDQKLEHKKRVMDVIGRTAAEVGVSRTVIALAWLMKHPSKIIPIVGSNNPDNIRDAVKADDVELTRDQWYRILLASRGEPLP
jgi:predicted oxidoreductase